MASTDPLAGGNQLTMMALAAVLLGFSSATQDIVIDAYRIESAESDLQALMSSTYIAGYRIGMLVAGAGALFLAGYFGSEMGSYKYQAWQWTYGIMALTMLVGIATTLIIAEPERNRERDDGHTTREYLGFLGMFVIAVTGFILSFYFSADWAKEVKKGLAEVFGNKRLASFFVELLRLSVAVMVAGIMAKLTIMSALVNDDMVRETYVEPIRDFFKRYGTGLAWLLLALVGLYRISDIVLGVISNVFFQDLGFTKIEIAQIVKTFGLFMTIFGGFLGGILSIRYGVMKILFLGALLTVVTNLLFLLLASAGNDIFLLYFVISADNLTAGLASAAFIAFLSSLTNVSFTAVQYAIFSSLMTLFPKIIGGYSGTIVDSVGYPNFFIIASLMGVPVLALVWAAARKFEVKQRENGDAGA